MPVKQTIYSAKEGQNVRFANGQFTGTLEVDGLLSASGGVAQPVTVAAVDGAVAIANSTVVITKGSAAALTLGIPTSAQNGTVITFISATAFAHTVTAATIGFNAANAAGDVGTFGAAIGNGFSVIAYEGEWLVLNNTNVTFA